MKISAGNTRTFLFISILLPFCIQFSIAQGHSETGFLNRSITVAGHTYLYQVYVPASYTPDRLWSVILFLHGAGERGSDGLLPTHVGLGAAIRQNPSRYPVIAVFPQAPKDSLWSSVPAQMAMAALDATMKEFTIDVNRVYLTGLSMGGNGTWYLAYRYPSKFAAITPICGWVIQFNPWASKVEPVVPRELSSPLQSLADQLKQTPTWIFHGEEDNAVPVEQSRLVAEAFKKAGIDVQYTELPGIGHNSWDAAYGSTKFVTWLFAQRRKP
ncbi:MAG: prolyl oligopeptidase family serine peptidase [bacterium]